MPVYILHGFRWPRPLIRIHIILQNLDDAAAEWLVAPGTTSALRENFEELYPEAMRNLENLRFIEQYDPHDLSPASTSQPYAYIADVVHEIRLGIDVEEVRGKGVTNEQWGSMLELRDKLAPDEKVGWYVVVCGDEERYAPSTPEVPQSTGYSQITGQANSAGYSPSTGQPNNAVYSPSIGQPQVVVNRPGTGYNSIVTYRDRGMSETGSNTSNTSDNRKVASPEPPKGFRSWLRRGSLSKKKSRMNIREIRGSDSSSSPPPPLPAPPGTAN